VILPQFRWLEARARWVSLEQRGFAHGWTYDHLAWRDLADEPWYATIPTLVAAAHRDEHLRLGTWGRLPQLPAPGDDGQVGRARPRPVTEPSPSRRR
jgi:alkanesulfonate monooxygenase SsuD/methylene tetrahydromethanopterin reductase-like flavin-dependent oxidoreductase (luciferase family)